MDVRKIKTKLTSFPSNNLDEDIESKASHTINAAIDRRGIIQAARIISFLVKIAKKEKENFFDFLLLFLNKIKT